jgi:hypothetical protein
LIISFKIYSETFRHFNIELRTQDYRIKKTQYYDQANKDLSWLVYSTTKTTSGTISQGPWTITTLSLISILYHHSILFLNMKNKLAHHMDKPCRYPRYKHARAHASTHARIHGCTNARALLLIANLIAHLIVHIVPNSYVAVMAELPCAICSPYKKSGDICQDAQEFQPLTECKNKVNLNS